MKVKQKKPKRNLSWSAEVQLKYFLKISFCVHNMIKESAGSKSIFKNL